MKRIIGLLFLLLLPSVAVGQAVTDVKYISVTPTVSNGVAYAAGDLIGGKMTFTGAVKSSTGSGQLLSVRITDRNKQAADVELVLFSSNPSSTTFTDNGAFDIATADLSKVVAVIGMGSTARFAYTTPGVIYLGNLLIPVRALSGASPGNTLYGALVSRGTPTYTSTSAITVTIAVMAD